MTHQHRYIPNTTADQQEILQACGADSFEALLGDGIPHEIRFRGELVGGRAQMSEFEIDRTMQDYFAHARNPSRGVSFLGSGSADRFCPTHVNQLTLRGEFLTAYTPYQPENSQGTLQALFGFRACAK